MRSFSMRMGSFVRGWVGGLVLTLGLAIPAFSQGYTSYFTGDTTDVAATPTGGVCMMGGAVEDDNAMRWFLNRSGGGDILVMRASGSNGYNTYLYSQLGVTVNSVETIRFDSPSAIADPYVQRRISEAEAIWFAGGDQFDYVTYWRGNAIGNLLNDAIQNRHIVVGGTSAGMAILGQYYFSAANGTTTTAIALANPYDATVTPETTPFLQVPYLDSVITDTHYDNPDRRGRHIAFLARILTDAGVHARGIACDEYTAVCIGTDGIAHVYGEYPTREDNAYFIQANCDIFDNKPEVCQSGLPLQWDQNSDALRVYHLQGTTTGGNTWDLNDWKTGVGGSWESWSVYSSALFTMPATQITCGPVAIASDLSGADPVLYPNPSVDGRFRVPANTADPGAAQVVDVLGQVVWETADLRAGQSIDLSHLQAGIYWLRSGQLAWKLVLE